MIFALTLNSAMAFNCTGADAEACADGAEAADLINSVMGAGTIIGSGGGVPFHRKTLFLQKKFAGIHNAAAANGCSIDDVVGGTYSSGDGSWSAERAASTQHGSFGGGGTVSGSDTNGADLGVTTGVFFDGDVFMDVHGSSTTFQAGVYRRVAGNIGYVAMLTGTCHGGNAAAALDGWYNGDLSGSIPTAEVTIRATVDNIYTLYVDGNQEATNSNWPTVTSTVLDLTPGDHTIAVMGQDLGGPAMFIMEVLDDVGGVLLTTHPSDWVSYDATTAAPVDWQEPGFDDSGWNTPFLCGANGIGPWGDRIAGADYLWDGASCSTSGTRLFRATLTVP